MLYNKHSKSTFKQNIQLKNFWQNCKKIIVLLPFKKKMIMRNLGLALLISLIVVSCNSNRNSGKPGVRGEIIPNKKSQKWTPETPFGMLPVPAGSFVLGQADQDFTYNPIQSPLRTVTVSAFFIDETEVTNAEYGLFVEYVRDSIARDLLAQKAGDGGTDGDGTAITDYAYKSKKTSDDVSPYDEYINSQGGRDGYDESKKLDWEVPLYWDTQEYPNVEYAEVLESMYYPPEQRFNNKRTINPEKLVYSFSYYDQFEAVKKRGRGENFLKTEAIPIYPDTTVWLRDFNYSYNEPMFEQYFWHEAFYEYPVVGVSWDQARAFCAFKTNLKNDYNASLKKKKQEVFRFRLPNESEWEYAARGGLEDASYPWGGPYLMDDRGCYLANFKPKRGDYIETKVEKNKKNPGFLYTAKTKTFHANGYGLYDMAGNVSEWTQSPYNVSSYLTSSTINPYLGNRIDDPFITIRGGSWKDIGYLLMVGARDYEHQDSARSFIGFRTVQTIPESANLNYRIKKK